MDIATWPEKVSSSRVSWDLNMTHLNERYLTIKAIAGDEETEFLHDFTASAKMAQFYLDQKHGGFFWVVLTGYTKMRIKWDGDRLIFKGFSK